MASISPGSSLGRYTIRQRLGEGGMATVYESLDPRLQRYVAIKVLPSYHTEDPSFPERFAQEAQAIARLNPLTQPQQALGTPDYMSPEQVMGKDADHRALGIMLYQMALGRTPYHADTVAATLLAHV